MVYQFFLFIERIFAYLQGKGYGTKTLKQEVKLALKLFGKKPNIVFDIGANKGHWTKFLLDSYPESVVHVFEPQPVCANEIEEQYNGRSNVILHRNAVSNVDAMQSLFFDFEGSGLASFSRRKLEHIGIDFSKSLNVRTVVLDEFLQTHGIVQIDIMKIDVEGHELAVFEGMKNTLLGLRPPNVIQFEFGGCNIDTRTFFRDFYLLFIDRYELYRQTPFGLTQIKKYCEIDECFRTTNYFLKLKD